MSKLKTLSLDELELVGVTQSDSEMNVNVNFPFSPAFPATTGMELEGGHNVVYFEIEPGKELGTHTDSPEELIICLDGDEVEAWTGDATGTISAGDLAVIPPMAPHGFRNTGDVTARFLGVFSDSTTVSEFEADLEPFGERTVKA
ncbi:cupin domain-containing protein [Natrinema amylolyticum]|uniref:cupin domain-containing protein n=1 Tax=Natrinema amylolyticum TaxID=2878679 RepID=UPI001CFC2FE3|nr:cupin domain-containing protein [Natrinema amylolyticum]